MIVPRPQGFLGWPGVLLFLFCRTRVMRIIKPQGTGASPVLALSHHLAVRRYLVSGLTAGAAKG